MSLTTIITAFLFLGVTPGFTAELFRIENLDDLAASEPTFELGVRVPGVQVAYANYQLIRDDFPALQALSNQQIDQWLVNQFAYIGSDQYLLNGIRNTPIPQNAQRETKPIFRPTNGGLWERAGLMEAMDMAGSTIGFVDIKGIGHGALSKKQVQDQRIHYQQGTEQERQALYTLDHSDGLMSLGEAVAETSRQQAAQKIFEKESFFETVETYAILSLPFEILKGPEYSIPAALYVRQSHLGRSHYLPVPEEIYTDSHGHRQQTFSGTAVDFGGVRLTHPLAKSHFGSIDSDPTNFDSQRSKPWVWGHQVAEAYRNGDKSAIYRHLSEMLEPLGESPSRDQIFEQRRELREVISALRRQGKNLRHMRTVPRNHRRISLQILEKFLSNGRDELLFLALEGRNDPETLRLIRQLLNDPDYRRRAKAVGLLGFRSDSESLSMIIHTNLQDKSAKVRTEALKALGGRRESQAVDHIRKVLSNPKTSAEDRKQALTALRNRSDLASLRLIQRTLSSPQSYSIMQAATMSLLGRTDPKSMKLIEILYLAGDEYKIVAIEALMGRQDAAALPLVKRALREENMGIKRTAIQVLITQQDSQSVELMKQMIGDKAFSEWHSKLEFSLYRAYRKQETPSTISLSGCAKLLL